MRKLHFAVGGWLVGLVMGGAICASDACASPVPTATPAPTQLTCPYAIMPPGPAGSPAEGAWGYVQVPTTPGNISWWCARVPATATIKAKFSYISFGTDTQCSQWRVSVRSPSGYTQVAPTANGNTIQYLKPLETGLYTIAIEDKSDPACNPVIRFTVSGG